MKKISIKNSIILGFAITLGSCFSSKVTPYYMQHPDHGIVSSESLVYKDSLNSCKQKIYGTGIDMGYHHVKDHREAFDIYFKLMHGIARKYNLLQRDGTIDYVKMNQMLEDVGKANDNHAKNPEQPAYKSDPDLLFLADFFRTSDELRKCNKSLGWKRVENTP